MIRVSDDYHHYDLGNSWSYFWRSLYVIWLYPLLNGRERHNLNVEYRLRASVAFEFINGVRYNMQFKHKGIKWLELKALKGYNKYPWLWELTARCGIRWIRYIYINNDGWKNGINGWEKININTIILSTFLLSALPGHSHILRICTVNTMSLTITSQHIVGIVGWK